MVKSPNTPDSPEEGEPSPDYPDTRGRERNGRFGTGNCANPQGRPRKDRSVSSEILSEFNRKITVNRGSKVKRVSKVSLSALQIANQGAKGDTRSAKLAIDLALKAESQCSGVPKAAPLTQNDRAIFERFIARLNLTQITE